DRHLPARAAAAEERVVRRLADRDRDGPGAARPARRRARGRRAPIGAARRGGLRTRRAHASAPVGFLPRPGSPHVSAPATLEFDSVTKRYPGAATPVIDDLTFDVPAGEICVLVGPSGCGKTTAMRMVYRMVDITAGD